MLSALLWLFWQLLSLVGLVAVAVFVALVAAPKMPPRLGRPIAKRLFSKAVQILGPELMLIRERDSRYTLVPRRYDAENGIYWADYGDEERGFEAAGKGGAEQPFLGGSLVLAYDGYGAVADIVSARIGYEAGQKYADGVPDTGHDGQGRAVADGGDELGVKEVKIPERGIVDLDDVFDFAPFNVRPGAFKRVEKNAKLSMSKFGNWGSVAQLGGMLAAFFLGALVVGVWGGGDGDGGSSAEVVPMTIEAVPLMLSALGVA